MNHLTVKKFLQLVKEGVKFMPEEMTTSRCNSYALISGIQDFNNDNLGYTPQDLQLGDVWTRKNQTINSLNLDYPICCPMIYNSSRTNNSHTGAFSTVYKVRILLADKVVDQKLSSNQREMRSITSIIYDCEAAMSKVLEYVLGCKSYKVETTTGQFTKDYFNKKYLDYAQAQGKIIGYTSSIEDKSLNAFDYTFNEFINSNNNIEMSILEYASTKDNIVGIWATINVITYGCNDGEFDFFIDKSAINDSKSTYFGK